MNDIDGLVKTIAVQGRCIAQLEQERDTAVHEVEQLRGLVNHLAEAAQAVAADDEAEDVAVAPRLAAVPDLTAEFEPEAPAHSD